MKRLPILAATLISTALLVACSAETPQQDACAPRGKNMLEDLTFSSMSAPRPQRKWLSSEHAAGQTFEYESNQGTLKIHKTGGEPWFILTQSIDPTELAGKRITFGAELKLDLQLPSDHAFTPGGGLSLLAKRGSQVVINSSLDHEPRLGQTEWTPVSVTVKVPPGTDSLRVGFLHQAEGTLRVRKPFVKRAPEKDCEP